MRDYIFEAPKGIDPYTLKNSVYAAFSKDSDTPRDFQYLVTDTLLAVRSPRGPKGFPPAALEREVPEFHEGQDIRFLVKTSPTRSHKGRHSPIKDPLEQRVWFVERARRHGFHVDSVLQERGFVTFRRDGGDVPAQIVAFSGEGFVTDAEAFSAMYRNGFGRMGAFGFGMMLVDME